MIRKVMFTTLKKELLTVDLSERKLRDFAFLIGGVLVVLGIYFVHADDLANAFLCGAIGTAFVLSGILTPTLLLPIYRLWMGLGILIGIIVGPVILSLLYLVIVTPIAIARRLASRKEDNETSSYWVVVTTEEKRDSLEHPF